MFRSVYISPYPLSSYIVAMPLMLVKKIFPYGDGEHNVCSSTTPVFNFLT